MRFSFTFTAALVTLVNAGEESFLRGDKAMMTEFMDLGFDIPDFSCFKQVWKSNDPDKDCPSKNNKEGSSCVWCGSDPSMGKMFAKAGACVTPKQTSFLKQKGMSCAAEATDNVIPETKDYKDETIMEELEKLGFDVPDTSCAKQVWKSESANTDCATKKDTSGGACVWCDASEKTKGVMRRIFSHKSLAKYPMAKEFIREGGACVTGKQTAFVEKKGLVCGSEKATPKIQ